MDNYNQFFSGPAGDNQDTNPPEPRDFWDQPQQPNLPDSENFSQPELPAAEEQTVSAESEENQMPQSTASTPVTIEPETLDAVETTNQTISLPQAQLALMQSLLDNLQQTVKRLADLLAPYTTRQPALDLILPQVAKTFDTPRAEAAAPTASQIVEGIFTGEKMLANDGQEYNVPVNYASKSKLVEGDLLKLIITERGTFVFKQIKPIERSRLVGTLEQGPTGEYYVSANNRRWRVLNASITYFRGEIGDEVIVLIPKEGQSRWAAVENVIRQNS